MFELQSSQKAKKDSNNSIIMLFYSSTLLDRGLEAISSWTYFDAETQEEE